MLAVGILAASSASIARPAEQTFLFDLPAQPLDTALRQVAVETGRQIIVAAQQANGKMAPALKGSYDADSAVRQLLAGSGIVASYGPAAILIGKSDPDQADPAIVVTGTRLEQGTTASPVISLSQKQIVQAGQTNVGDALLALPQDFGGGQNPGVANGVSIGNQNINGGSSANLRGLGPSATLTLLNGHRLPYGSFIQAVDIGSIPLASVDRVDIVADGTSAIYGSDAVGGVVNILLKPDYEGLTTSARVGGATDGGDFEQQYDATGGARWGSGGFIASYDFQRNSGILSGQRTYTALMPAGNSLYPGRQQNSGILSGHQAIGPDITLSLDATYNNRTQSLRMVTSSTSGYLNSPRDVAFSLAPTLKANIGRGWTAYATGLYGKDNTHYALTSSYDGSSSLTAGCYCNTTRLGEVSAKGGLFDIPGGPVSLAVGAGYRWNGFYVYSDSSQSKSVNGSEHSLYGFGELFVPFASPSESIPGLYRLTFDAALRFEHYPGMANVATPKLGLVYAPSADIDLKASWGQSFKAPNVDQLYEPIYSYLYPAAILGGSRFGPNSTVILEGGGDPTLKPERADSWSATLEAHPRAIDGLTGRITYFHVNYRNRIVQAFTGPAIYNALIDPAYADYVTYDPTSAQQAEAISLGGMGLTNATTGPYDPSAVAAIVNNSYVNAARQHIQGVDAEIGYKFATERVGSFSFDAMASWLDSHQKLSSTAGWTPLSGTIFNPPHWRGRFLASWSSQGLTVTSVVNYTGGVDDVVVTPNVRVGSQTSLDFTLNYDVPTEGGLLHKVSFTLTMRNALNQRPPYSAPSGGANYYVPYDSTNYSAIGRFIGLTVSKSW